MFILCHIRNWLPQPLNSFSFTHLVSLFPELGDTIGSLFGSSDTGADGKPDAGPEKTEVFQIAQPFF